MRNRFRSKTASTRDDSTDTPRNNEPQQIVHALHSLQAVIEFEMDGTIIDANENFLNFMGYESHEIVGRNHQMFMLPHDAADSAYTEHWAMLRSGQQKSNRYRRVTRDGREVWLQASYIPLLDDKGIPVKVFKIATDVTEQTWQAAEFKDQVTAISHSLAVIEFNLDGTVITANENFLNTAGYPLHEIRGQHHR